MSTVDISVFHIGINDLIVAVNRLETRWLTPGRHPCHRPARDQDVEGHHQPQIGAAPEVVGADPGRHEDAPLLAVEADAEVQVAVVGAEDDLVLGLKAGGEDGRAGLTRLEAEGADEGVAEPEKCSGPAGEGQATGGGFAWGEGGGNRVAVEKVAGAVEGPERGGAGQGDGEGGHGKTIPQLRPLDQEAG